ncbi:hypothetical protein NQZ68_008713 [Dissostichus eleginoides]|nr:hypothetical protein NQZ68_008710 [Dissostichus eleginoides]KAI9543666.1 hypothetical protein NQZ68_008713 [Dissostichus eleginoides]
MKEVQYCPDQDWTTNHADTCHRPQAHYLAMGWSSQELRVTSVKSFTVTSAKATVTGAGCGCCLSCPVAGEGSCLPWVPLCPTQTIWPGLAPSRWIERHNKGDDVSGVVKHDGGSPLPLSLGQP